MSESGHTLINTPLKDLIDNNGSSYLVEFPEEEHVAIVNQIVHFDVRQAMHHQHNKISDAVHAFLSHEQDLA